MNKGATRTQAKQKVKLHKTNRQDQGSMKKIQQKIPHRCHQLNEREIKCSHLRTLLLKLENVDYDSQIKDGKKKKSLNY